MRRSGKTTRTIDRAVQTFFEKGSILIPDMNRVLRMSYYGGEHDTAAYLKRSAGLFSAELEV